MKLNIVRKYSVANVFERFHITLNEVLPVDLPDIHRYAQSYMESIPIGSQVLYTSVNYLADFKMATVTLDLFPPPRE